MKKSLAALALAGAIVATVLLGCSSAGEGGGGTQASDIPEGWGAEETWELPTETQLDPADFVEGVDNPYWPLTPGYGWVYEAETDEGTEHIEVTVLDETRVVAGIECMVVRDTVAIDGELLEDTRDWYAQDVDGNVWYMGEEVDNYVDGVVDNHGGSWEAGVDGALPGIKVWAEPKIGGAPYYQEFYEGEAEDLGRDLALDGTASVPAGEFTGLLVVEEWNKLDPEVIERKYYAKGLGTVLEETTRGGDEVVKLVRTVPPYGSRAPATP